MEINELKDRLDNLRTNKAILENDRRKILKTLKSKYDINSVADAKKALPKVEKRRSAAESARDQTLQEAEELLNQFEDEEEED